MALPDFRYHPDPIRSGSVVESDRECRCCGQSREYMYAGPVYSEDELSDRLCPWCIADGSAHEKFDATFVDAEILAGGIPGSVALEIGERTPGFNTWQGEAWPACCDDATAFVEPTGIADIRSRYRELEGAILNHIIYEMEISGSAATRLLQSLNKDRGPTAYVFRCLHCDRHHFHIDQP